VARAAAVVEQDPKNPAARNLFGELQVAAKDYVAAQKQFGAASELAPKWWIPYRNLALLQLNLNDVPGAIATFRKGVAATQYQIALVTDLATLLEREGRSEESIKLYESALAANPKQEIAANNLAMLLITYRKEQASLDRARDLTAAFANTNNGALLDTYGWIRFKRGEVTDGLPALERAAELAPQSGVVRYHLGMAQLQSGQKDKARTSLKTALGTNQTFAGIEEARATLTTLDKKAG
jgi:tetratricopeptide (TPR) repeat protein